MAAIVFPREGQGFRAELRIGEEHIVLLAAHSALGPASAIYDAKRKKWWSEREWAEDIEDAKQKAEGRARKWYKAVGFKEPFPELRWTEMV